MTFFLIPLLQNDSFHEKQLSLKKRIESIAHNGKANSMDKTSSISSLISAINNSNSSGQRFHGHLSGDNIGRATVEHDFFSRTPSTVNKSSCSMLSNVQRKNDDSSYSEKKTPCIPNDSRLSTTISPDEWRKLYNTLSSNYKSETKRANFEHSPINSISKKEISSVPSALQTPPNHLIRQQRGVFFRRSSAHFGAVAIGSLSRTKLELCNATNEEVKFVFFCFYPHETKFDISRRSLYF